MSKTPWAAGIGISSYQTKELPDEEKTEIRSTVEADMPRIVKAERKVQKVMQDFEDVSQKHILERVIAGWAISMTTHEEEARALVAHLRDQSARLVSQHYARVSLDVAETPEAP